MFIVGLTGGIGSGKSTVAALFAKHGIAIIDTDQLARDVAQPGSPALKKIVEKWGSSILLSGDSLNRSALRQIVFKNESDRRWLENLLHPLIRLEMKKQAEQAASPYCIVIIPLLFETGRDAFLDRVLVVDAPEEKQISRTQIRDKATQEEVKAILDSQVSRETRLNLADDVIENKGSIADLEDQVDKLHQSYLKMAIP